MARSARAGKAATNRRSPGARGRSRRSVTVDGNRLHVLTEGPERLAALIELIDSAGEDLRLLYYMFADDISGAMVKQAILRAIGRGVEVALLVDDFGSSNTKDDYFQEISEAGATFCRFHPSFGRRYLLRNHQKLALADAKSAHPRVLIGGFNIEDDYFAAPEQDGWRDIGLVVEGPAAARLTPYFDDLMGWAKSKRARISRLREIIFKYSETKGSLQWQLGGPTVGLSPWGVSTCRDLLGSRDVEMIAAYFAPPKGVRRSITRAGTQGRARLVTAAKSDNTATIAAARFTYQGLLDRGVRIYEYLPTKLHTKLVVMDEVVHIGSSNLDIRSLYLNMELMLRVDDRGFAEIMRTYFEGELKRCLEITPEIQNRRASLLNRLRWALSFFLVTSLDYTATRRLNFGLGGG